MSSAPDTSAVKNPRQIACADCPLRESGKYRDFNSEELAFVSKFKRGELSTDEGSTILVEGSNTPHLYTVTYGWGFRYKLLEDGRRQILNYVMPGDFIGLQGSLLKEMDHSVAALTSMQLCLFERDRLFDLYKGAPSLGYDITWMAAREEQMLDEHLLSVGRRNAFERAAYLLAYLYERSKMVGLFADSPKLISPLTQQHVADTLGLSLVHTNKTLKKLSAQNLVEWRDSGFNILDIDGLRKVAGWDGLGDQKRPFI